MIQKVNKALILSAYDAKSHQLWRQRLLELFPNIKWTQLSLPPRHFSWRIRGNSLLWALNEADTLNQDYDVLVVTSMVDLSALRGLVPSLASIPSLVYFHENQFAYPSNQGRDSNVEHQLVPLYSAYCASLVAFNSQYNKDSFLLGAQSLINKLPDQFSSKLMEKLEKSVVVPVPLPSHLTSNTRNPSHQLELVWNHRWEYDKGPSLLLDVVELIVQQQLPVKVHVLGERFRECPSEFAAIDSLLDQHSELTEIPRGHFGRISSAKDYEEFLKTCDVALSTANHDFQGLAIQEASLCGCTPLTPFDLAYKDYIPEELCYARQSDNASTALRIIEKIERYSEMIKANEALPRIDLSDYRGAAILEKYKSLLDNLMAKNKAASTD